MEEESIDIDKALSWEKQINRNPISDYINETMGMQVHVPPGLFLLPTKDVSKKVVFKKIDIGWYIRVYKFELLVVHKSTPPLHSEIHGYSKFKRIGNWRFNISKLK